MAALETGFSGQASINKKIFLTWDDVKEGVKDIHKYLLAANYLVDAIIMPHKGGMIPGTMLGYRLNTDELYVLKMRNNELFFPKDITNLARKRVLIVDNIIETGENLPYMMQILERVGVAQIMVVALIQKNSDKRVLSPQYSARTIAKDDWAIFPWEELNY